MKATDNIDSQFDLAEQAIAHMRAFGADCADVLVSQSISLGATCRLGQVEEVERAEAKDMGLRALIGKKQAFVSGAGLQAGDIEKLAERVVAMAQKAPEDPFCGLADENLLATQIAELDLNDINEPSTSQLQAYALEAEDTARAIKGISNSEGAGANWGRSTTSLVTSHGFAAHYTASSWSLYCVVLAGTGDNMERDYASHATRHFEDLDTPATIGALAAERTLKRLNPCKPETIKAPVMYAPRVSASLLKHFASAISGSAVARGTSFLKDAMGQKIMPANIQIIDDPLRQRGLRSAGFDGEGLAADKLKLVKDGILQNWLLESASAKQLGLTSNGRASRGTASPPHPSATNLYIEAGEKSPAELMQEMGSGLYVNELIGMGVNGVTGDYSRGATGFWIENGKPAYPVSELTIASNLRPMFANLTAANDLTFRYGVNAPSLLIEEMTIAGL